MKQLIVDGRRLVVLLLLLWPLAVVLIATAKQATNPPEAAEAYVTCHLGRWSHR